MFHFLLWCSGEDPLFLNFEFCMVPSPQASDFFTICWITPIYYILSVCMTFWTIQEPRKPLLSLTPVSMFMSVFILMTIYNQKLVITRPNIIYWRYRSKTKLTQKLNHTWEKNSRLWEIFIGPNYLNDENTKYCSSVIFYYNKVCRLKKTHHHHATPPPTCFI